MRYLALFRAVNVSGHRIMPMADLRACAEGLGFTSVKTYVQSGNLVFETKKDMQTAKDELLEACRKTFGFDNEIILRDADSFFEQIASCPFVVGEEPKEGMEAKFLHGLFLDEGWDMIHIQQLFAAYEGSEKLEVKPGVVWIYYTNGSARSKLTPLLNQKKLGVFATSRNWKSIQKLKAMLS